jgi:hypothetical protein
VGQPGYRGVPEHSASRGLIRPRASFRSGLPAAVTRRGLPAPGYHLTEPQRTSCNGRVGRMHLRLVRAFKRCRISLSYASTASHSGERGTGGRSHGISQPLRVGRADLATRSPTSRCSRPGARAGKACIPADAGRSRQMTPVGVQAPAECECCLIDCGRTDRAGGRYAQSGSNPPQNGAAT